MKTIARLGLLFVVLVVNGCGQSTDSPSPNTGSREAVKGFYEAFIRRDYPGAYSLLHPDSTKSISSAEFSRRADTYRGRLGFDPVKVAVRTCDEHGDEATARVSLNGPGGGRHSYGDNLFLRRHEGQWRVILPARFGQR